MPTLNLTKHHGLGNDFLVLLDLADQLAGDTEAMARALCDRHRGVGADGLIRVGPGRDGADVGMDLRNADGSRAEMSGNGIRCLAQAVVDAAVEGGPELTVSTDAGLRHVVVYPEQARGRRQVAVDMGPVKVGDDDPEWVEDIVERATRADAGNPHLVLLVPDPAAVDVTGVGRFINGQTPGGMNVEFIRAEGPGAIALRVFERGVGETQACGTGAVAAAAVANSWGLVLDEVTVHMLGGPAKVALGETVTLEGPTQLIAHIEVLWPRP